MPTYERETSVRAPLEDVWEFHSRVSGLEALTPALANLRVESVIGPHGGPDPDVLEAGSEVALSIRPFGVGPRREWTSVVVDRGREDGTAYFRDEMVHGPFDRWEHTHAFYADGDRTTLRDHVEYDLPFGLDAVGPFARIGLEPLFRHRHRAARRALEEPRRTAER